MEKDNVCSYCNKGILIQTRGELVCNHCGAVNNSLFLSGPTNLQIPWDHEMAPGKRVHIVDGLGSYIGYHNDGFFHDGKGTTLSSQNQNKFRKLKRKYNLRIKLGNHETDYRSLLSLNRVTSFLGLSDTVRKRAAFLYKTVSAAESKKKIEKVSNHIVLVALCLMVAIRESTSNAPIRLSEIVSVFKDLGHRVSGKSIIKLAQSLPPELGISLRTRKSEDYLQRIIGAILQSPEISKRLLSLNLIPREYGNNLLRFSRELLADLSLRERGGRNPYIFAVSVVYCADRIVAKVNSRRQILTQKTLSEICKVAEYSIRDHHRTVLKYKLQEMLPKLLPQSTDIDDEPASRFPMLF